MSEVNLLPYWFIVEEKIFPANDFKALLKQTLYMFKNREEYDKGLSEIFSDNVMPGRIYQRIVANCGKGEVEK